jgi:hypothetical protein
LKVSLAVLVNAIDSEEEIDRIIKEKSEARKEVERQILESEE